VDFRKLVAFRKAIAVTSNQQISRKGIQISNFYSSSCCCQLLVTITSKSGSKQTGGEIYRDRRQMVVFSLELFWTPRARIFPRSAL
jgi:hypothetical protein